MNICLKVGVQAAALALVFVLASIYIDRPIRESIRLLDENAEMRAIIQQQQSIIAIQQSVIKELLEQTLDQQHAAERRHSEA
jgi:hypothetical protein